MSKTLSLFGINVGGDKATDPATGGEVTANPQQDFFKKMMEDARRRQEQQALEGRIQSGGLLGEMGLEKPSDYIKNEGRAAFRKWMGS
jgi:hypothetical protein